MLARIQECILYRGFSNGEILDDMTELINLYEADEEALKAREDQFFKSVNGLVELAGMYGFSGNIWHTYLTFLLVNHENAFSMASEIRGAIKGSINDLAKNDFQIFKELYDFDITVFDKVFGTVCCRVICDYQTPDENSKLFNTRIRDRICQMSKTLCGSPQRSRQKPAVPQQKERILPSISNFSFFCNPYSSSLYFFIPFRFVSIISSIDFSVKKIIKKQGEKFFQKKKKSACIL